MGGNELLILGEPYPDVFSHPALELCCLLLLSGGDLDTFLRPRWTGERESAYLYTLPREVVRVQRLPQIETGKGTVRAPGFCNSTQLLGAGHCGQAVGPFGCSPDAEVAHWQHLRPAQLEYEKHITTPLPNTLDRDEP